MSETRHGTSYDQILEIAESKLEGWTGMLSPDDVQELESIGLIVRELPNQESLVERRCQVTRPELKA